MSAFLTYYGGLPAEDNGEGRFLGWSPMEGEEGAVAGEPEGVGFGADLMALFGGGRGGERGRGRGRRRHCV